MKGSVIWEEWIWNWIYGKGRYEMGGNNESENNEQDRSAQSNGLEITFRNIRNKYRDGIAKILLVIFTACFTTAVQHFYNNRFVAHDTQILVSDITNRLDLIDSDDGKIAKLKAELKEEDRQLKKELTKTIKELKKDLKDDYRQIKSDIRNTINLIKCKPTSIGRQTIPLQTTSMEVKTNAATKSAKEKIIATDSLTGEKIKTKDVVNKLVLMPYVENGQEVFFLGHFNANYHWDGNCIVNVYNNNRLILITEAVYDDGKLISYKQVLEYGNNSDAVWIISNRKRCGNENKGISSSFYKEEDKKKKFTLKNVKIEDIISVSQFKKSLNTAQKGFYYGKTSNGDYNDNTGRAYLVKYNENGKVCLFYCGRFKDGQPHDHTGQAWDIVLGENGKYVFRQAKHTNGDIDYPTITKRDYNMTPKKIEDKLKGLNIKCDLPWDF